MKKVVERSIWILSAVLVIYMSAAVMRGAAARLGDLAENRCCARPLDLFKMGFDEEEVMRSFQCMGPEALEAYRSLELREDAFYPLAYGLFLTLSVWLLAGASGSGGRLRWLAFVPVAAVWADFVENAHIVQLLDQFPVLDSTTLRIASIFNTVKWALAFLSLGIISVLGIKLMLRRSMVG